MGTPPLEQDDRDALRYLAALGKDDAGDRLADLAVAAGDVGEPTFMWEEGYERSGELMTLLAIADRDLVRLHALSKSGVAEAQDALDSFLSGS
ncbi:hypothetical protein ABIB25_003283 [Nakamurella sp. UYEF19]|uniref:hypothetical protein n=1 Tax=Nakamurella sp. UYEF19 TaxID=1756392 RepID=UPI003392AB6E